MHLDEVVIVWLAHGFLSFLVVVAFFRGLPPLAPLVLDVADLASDLIERSAAAGLISSTCPQLVQVWFMVWY